MSASRLYDPKSMQCIHVITDSSEEVQSSEENSVNLIQQCVWERSEPTTWMFIMYGFVVPVLASFGFCANFINTIVFMRPKMTPSAFTYLAALSFLDCLSCLLIVLTAFSRSIFYYSHLWLSYDFQWQTPLFGVTTGAANLILASVSLDRLVYLWHGIPGPGGSPRFCKRRVARRVIALVVVISVTVNFPYFFVFVVNDDGTFQTTDFYCSNYYKIHNWLTFVLLTVLPAIFLLVGNAAIVIAFRRWTKQSRVCHPNSKITQKRYQHQMKLTITIVIVIALFMIGELPAHLTSRKSAVNLLFGGDTSKVNLTAMERLELICLMLNSIQLSMNIIVYALINPSFMPEFFQCLRGASDKCFRWFCLTAIGNCWRRHCQCWRKRAHDGTADDAHSHTVRHRKMSQHGPVTDTWSSPCDENQNRIQVATVDGCCKKYRERTGYPRCKRSSSFSDFAFDNPLFSDDLPIPHADGHNNCAADEGKQKRHSLGV